MKYHAHRQILLNKKIPLGLRIKIFNAFVLPAALYSLSSTPLTVTCLEMLDATQRTMFRNIVGWPQFTAETWEERGRTMKTKLDNVFTNFGLKSWSETLQSKKETLQQRECFWTTALQQWDPSLQTNIFRNKVVGKRHRARPRMRWNEW